MNDQIQKIIKNSKQPQLIKDVFEFAKNAYGDKKRLSGEAYIDHAVNIALILDNMGLDQTTICAGILHEITDAPSLSFNQKVDLREIEKKFGWEISHIVEKSSEIKRIYYSFNAGDTKETFFNKENVENVRKMFLAISGDIRVVLIELASRINGLAKINLLPPKMQKLYATETLQIFVPIANRLGLGEVKTRLEDASFANLYPNDFAQLQQNIEEKYEERQAYLKKFIPHLKKIFKKEKIAFLKIDYRAKSYWSAYQKLQKRNMDFEKIYDLVALRIIVNNVSDCYKALGIIHKYYKPISERIKDYIAKPKLNGYRSLHTTVFLEQDKISEIQIKTNQMYQDAEYGVCAHWSYKEKVATVDNKKFDWVAEIPSFWKNFKIDFFENQIFVFTPNGDVIILPKASTPIDFAYAIHSEIGNHCEGAKRDGKIIPLSELLKNGDVIEIITNKKRAPSQDWLRFVKTGFAKSHIKKFALAIPSSILSIPSFLKKKIFGASKKPHEKEEKQSEQKISKEIYLAGQKGMMVTMAKCCTPTTGDQAKAYITRHRAAVLHKISCMNLQKLSKNFPEKVVEASWE